MLRLLPNPWLILAAVMALTGAYGAGRYAGASAADARHAAALSRAQDAAARAAEAASRREAARLAAEAEAADLARQLEDMAHEDPATGCGLPAGRVLRLNRY